MDCEEEKVDDCEDAERGEEVGGSWEEEDEDTGRVRFDVDEDSVRLGRDDPPSSSNMSLLMNMAGARGGGGGQRRWSVRWK